MKSTQNIIITFVTITLLTFFSAANAFERNLHVNIIGIQDPLLKNAQDRLAISQKAMPNLNVNTIESFYKNAPQIIKQSIEPFGYFKPTIYPRLTHQGSSWTASFYVEPGQPLHVTELHVSISGPGENNPALEKLLNDFPISARQVFKVENYERAKKALLDTANAEGYLKATLENKIIQIDLKKYTSVIILHLNTGQRYYFGEVTFNENAFSTRFLKRFLSFKEGEPFSSGKLLKFQQNLSSSNYFQTVAVNPDLLTHENFQVPIKVDVTEMKSQQYNAGVGYGSFTGPRLTLSGNFRRLTNTGHHMDFQVKLSPVLSGLATQYIIPGKNPLTDQYTIGANIQKFMPKNGNSVSTNVSGGYVKTINEWKNTYTLTFLRERYNIDSQSYHNSLLLFPSVDFARVKADDLINTRFGSKVDFMLRGASKQFISNTNFIQAEIKGKYIFSPTKLSRIILRGDFGYTVVNDLSVMPLSLQFFAGGLESVRGFPFSYFGPGRYLKTGSIELQHRIYGKVNGAVFYDVGMADNHINAPMGRGIGVGIIYDSVIGPVKVYTGFGHLAKKPTHFDLEFSIGPDL